MRYGERKDQEDNRDVESMWRELFGSGPAIGSRSKNGEALGGTREAAVGVCALARGEAKVYGAQAAQEGAEGGDGEPGEGVAGSHGLLPGEAGGIGPGARLESLSIDDTPVSEENRVGPAQHQTAKAFIPEWPGNEAP